jgi:hypothetical protein
MFTTPAFSPTAPPSAPKTIGTESSTAPPIRRTTGKSRAEPAPAQARNARRTRTANTTDTRTGTGRDERTMTNARTERTTRTAKHAHATPIPGTDTSGMRKKSPSEEKRNFVCPSRGDARSSSPMSTAMIENATGTLLLVTVT